MIRILGDRVLVALPPKNEQQEATTGYTYQEKTTASGLIIAKPPDAYDVEAATRGIVMQLGEKSDAVSLDDVRAALEECYDARLDAYQGHAIASVMRGLKPAPFDVQVGDLVVFPPNVGEQYHYNGVEYLILLESQIAGVIEPASEAA